MDTSLPKEDGLLLPQELISQCLPGPMFKCQDLKLHDCRGASQRRIHKAGRYTDDANCPLWKLFGGHLSCLCWGQLFKSTQFLTFWQLEIQLDASWRKYYEALVQFWAPKRLADVIVLLGYVNPLHSKYFSESWKIPWCNFMKLSMTKCWSERLDSVFSSR